MSFFIGCTASLLSIAMLAIERAIAVNATYQRKLPRMRAVKMSVAIWIFSLIFSCIYFGIGYFKFAFIFSIFMIAVIFVTLVTAFVYSRRRIRLQIKEACGSQMQQRQVENDRRVTNSFKAILIFYAICNVPSCVAIFLVNFCETCNCTLIHWSRDLLAVFVLVNCSGNQFLYAWKMKSFKRAFRSLVQRPVPDNVEN